MRKAILFALQMLVLIVPAPALAGSYLAFDVPFTLKSEEFSHQSVLFYDSSLSVSMSRLVPDDVEITSLSMNNNLVVFAVDKPAALDGKDFTERDLISYDLVSGDYALYQDLSSVLPPGVIIDALSIIDATRFVFSVDIPTAIFGTVFSPSDLIEYHSGAVALYLSAEALEIPGGINLDAISIIADTIHFSVDIPSTIGGLTVSEADIIERSGSHALASDAKAAGFPEGVNLTAYEIFPGEVLPLPSGQDIFTYIAAHDPVKSPDPSLCNPVAAGDVAGGTIHLQVTLPSFSAAVDVYLGFYVPAINLQTVYVVTPSGYNIEDLQPFPVEFILTPSGIRPAPWLPAWKANHTSYVSEALFGEIEVESLAPGTYYIGLLVSPAGTTETFYFWNTSVEIP